ncbi:MAG: Methanol oxidation s, glmU-like protein [Myxococcaceae bacterium]|nr:Methanol oxidation s, glmU-like protein [Myxococcaceae bacterium]
MLAPVAEDLWTVARPQRFWGLETGTRMTVARLSDGGLFVHCPVALDADTRRAVDALGPVRAIVASSLFHHLYAGEWARAYPAATLWACPGLPQKRPDLPWTGVLGDAPDASWAADVDQRPFTARFEREVVFFHRKSRTMVCADAMLNLWQHPSPVTRAAALLMGNLGPGRGYLERIAVRDWALGRQQVDRILEWDIDGVVLAHGGLLAHGGRDALRDAYDWL